MNGLTRSREDITELGMRVLEVLATEGPRLWFAMCREAASGRMFVLPDRLPQLESILQTERLHVALLKVVAQRGVQVDEQLGETGEVVNTNIICH